MSEISHENSLAEIKSNELNGKKLYAPGIIVAYTILANVPVGLILYGINIINRGFKTYGKIVLWSGIISGIILAVIMANGELPGMLLMPIGIMCGIAIYKYEDGPYKKAIALGARKAKWWPPLLFLLIAIMIYYSYILLFSS